MEGFRLDNAFIDLTDHKFHCPYCNSQYFDYESNYMQRINKNKSGITKVKCDCENTFHLTMDMQGNYQTFKGKI